ncbi:MAG: efflux transporter periplasmic adaptor subunit [Caulobacterales bacterium 68-7]|nr:MAG: efflux transporter periplasmic adaptor subunit [Caulobacterales bacterium 68-7]
MPEPGKRRMSLGVPLTALAALLVVGFGVAARVRSTSELKTTATESAVPSVSVIQPKAGGKAETLTLPANLQAYNTAQIFARTTGYVNRWLVNIGEPVRRGQLLAVLDAPDVQMQLDQARADLQTARAQQQLARTTADRWSTMLAKDAVSRQESDEKQGDLAAKTAVAAAAQANVGRLQTLTGFTQLTAPFDGVVTTRSAEIGALVITGVSATPLYTVADVSRMRVFVRVPQAYSSQLSIGMPVKLTVPEYPNRTFDTTLVRTAGAVDAASGAVLVELQAANGDRALKPGSYAQVQFPLKGGGEAALTLPPSAVMITEDGPQVALLGPNNHAQLRKVSIGRDFGRTIEIAGGLKRGDKVIDSPPESLQDGDEVRVVAAAQAATGPGRAAR